MYKEIAKCRICGNSNLIPIFHLGNFYLTGVFPKTKGEKVTSGPLELIKCQEDNKGRYCGLLQLKQSYEPDEMYGNNYGYRSGLNRSMINHLQNQITRILDMSSLTSSDLIIDIGSNDGTLLAAYPNHNLTLVGIDPTGYQFQEYYPDYIQLIPDYFSADIVQKHFGDRKAKIITSFAMFYDLESPIDFMKKIYEVLDDTGIWVFEQSYMPTMLARNLYDTICHEHLEYYRLKQIKWMTDEVGFKIIDIGFNDVNGGSFFVTVVKKGNNKFQENTGLIERILANEEKKQELSTLKPYQEFKKHIDRHRDELQSFIRMVKTKNQRIFGYGASTKGNVILQFCNFTAKDIPYIAEVNNDKFHCYTPGTGIPIISESEAKAMRPDYFLVLPWHFRETIILREKDYLDGGGSLVMPLPQIEVVTKQKSVQQQVK